MGNLLGPQQSVFTGRPENLEHKLEQLSKRRLSSMQTKAQLLSESRGGRHSWQPNVKSHVFHSEEALYGFENEGSVEQQSSRSPSPVPVSVYAEFKKREEEKKRNQDLLSNQSQGQVNEEDLAQKQPPLDKETASATKEATPSTHAETKQKQGQESETIDALHVRRASRENNMSLDITKDARGLFDRYATYPQGAQGYLSYENFGRIVTQIMKAISPQLSEEDLKTKIEVSWREADRDYNGKVDFDEFAAWYSSVGFQEEFLLSPQQILIRGFAKTYDLSITDVESLQAKFQHFDVDGSGIIEYGEFEQLLCQLMKVPRGQELPVNRVKHFWKEIDLDGSGGVDFGEFLQWYIKYFDMKGNVDICPIGQLYQSCRPNFGRSM